MTDDLKEPRRYKMASELTDDERAASNRFGASGRRFERDEYRAWRSRVLRDERDDLALRARLLKERALGLRTRAADRKTDGLSKLTAEDWVARDAAKREGKEVDPLDDGGGAGLEEEAAKLEAEAQEIAAHLAVERDAA